MIIPEFTKHEPGTFCYAELISSDPSASGNFYTDLFGWSRNDQDMGEFGIYTQFQINGKVVAAQYKMVPEQKDLNVPPNWGQYISVNDADATSAKVAELGGQVVTGPMDVQDYGRMSVLADPAGAVFCIWQPKANIGVQWRDDPGAICWNELKTTDTAGARTFYDGVFGWQTEVMDLGEMGQYTLFNRNGGQDVGGMMAIQPEMGPLPPHWLLYFAVEDVDASLERSISLGGKAMAPATDIPNAGRFAVICDPVGAVFAIYKSAKTG